WEPSARIRAFRSQPRARSRASRLGLLPGTSAPLEVRWTCRVSRGESARLPRPTRTGTQWPVGNGSTRAENGPCTTSEPPFVEFRDSLSGNRKVPNFLPRLLDELRPDGLLRTGIGRSGWSR